MARGLWRIGWKRGIKGLKRKVQRVKRIIKSS
jgi:hypothetical protein